ncbi:zinc finger protein ZIC 5-like [Selaginella moellendorffii]|uniref:zinc finger protein ZIC 5-like n=1 Tax=Selaginella moellendorffii TaxID=88036 RepID=UPI000D1D04DF|nr:zinc finger protein ZIC 5-like [Selaginella moellendorffii]|eukprot:XP_024517299.1 zinc finger protein ZIC 5-like [Selaginella moellendorffii]
MGEKMCPMVEQPSMAEESMLAIARTIEAVAAADASPAATAVAAAATLGLPLSMVPPLLPLVLAEFRRLVKEAMGEKMCSMVEEPSMAEESMLGAHCVAIGNGRTAIVRAIEVVATADATHAAAAAAAAAAAGPTTLNGAATATASPSGAIGNGRTAIVRAVEVVGAVDATPAAAAAAAGPATLNGAAIAAAGPGGGSPRLQEVLKQLQPLMPPLQKQQQLLPPPPPSPALPLSTVPPLLPLVLAEVRRLVKEAMGEKMCPMVEKPFMAEESMLGGDARLPPLPQPPRPSPPSSTEPP